MKIKRILAFIAIILLVGMYVATLVFSLSDSPMADSMFKASIFCTVVIPVAIYAGAAILRVFAGHDSDKHKEN